jgi:hypothetical protein
VLGWTLLPAQAHALANNRLLTSVPEVAALSNEQFNAGIPVHLQAIVTFYDYRRFGLNVTDGGRSLYVTMDWSKGELPIRPGDSIRGSAHSPCVCTPRVSSRQATGHPRRLRK